MTTLEKFFGFFGVLSMLCLLLWNVINLLDGEARWFLTFLFVLTIAAVISHVWRWLCTRLHKKFQNTDQFIKDAAIQAAFLPVTCYIWFLTIIQCLDLISDRFFSDSFTSGFKLIFGASAVLAIGWFLLKFKQNLTNVLIEKSRSKEIALDPGKVYGIAKLLSVIIVVLVVLLLMEVTGVSVNTLIAFGGISGLAIAFASQEIIANFFSGIMIHINQPFSLGEQINVPGSGIEGNVEEIGWYETCIRSKDKQPIYIPNSLFSKAFVVNGNRRTHRRIGEKISIRHEDLDKASAIMSEIRAYLKKSEHIDTSNKILVSISEVSACSIDISIACLSKYVDEEAFLGFRDVVLLHAAQVILKHGAQLAIPVEGILSLDKN